MDINGGIKVNFYLTIIINIHTGYVLQTTPLILASKNGHEKCVKQLLQRPHVDVTIQDEDGHNCLALAVLHRHLYVFLGAITCSHHHMLIDRQAALAIINSPYWQEALKGCDKHFATPLRLLIKHLPGIQLAI